MATYKVKAGQNIFDVAVHLYGSIEGLFDLLISNRWLSMTTELKSGMELEYHDYFVVNEQVKRGINKNDYTPANRERHVYPKIVNEQLVAICDVNAEELAVCFDVSGSGNMLIDWGDNSPVERISLGNAILTCEHNFDNITTSRRIKIYGTFTLTQLDITGLCGTLFPLMPMVVDEFISRANGYPLQGLFLFDSTAVVDLQRMKIDSLLPIADMSLQELNLSHVQFASVDVLDEYLQYIVSHYGQRRSCTVHLTQVPSAVGMAAIDTIINEPQWNVAGKWKFIINDTIYTAQ